jgi:hypothetical protein
MQIGYPDPIKLGVEFKQWSAGLRTENYGPNEFELLVTFRFWVSRMQTRQANQMAFEIAELCALPGFDLIWFQETLRQPGLHSHSSQMLTYFGLSIYERWDSQHHLKILSWMKAPNWNGNRDFAWQIYLGLVEAGFTDLPGKFLMDSAAFRTLIIRETIQKAYSQDYHLLVALTREIIYLQPCGKKKQGHQNLAFGQLAFGQS